MRKSILRTLILSVILTMMLTVSAFAESASVTGNGVNVRSGPGLNYPVIDSLGKGTVVTITDRSDSGWYAVSYDGNEGFMSSAYLSINTETIASVTVTASSGGETGYVNAMFVRFRSGPSSDYSVLGEYNTGKLVTITGEVNTWKAVTIDGIEGYIYGQFITVGTPPAQTASQTASQAVVQPAENDDSEEVIVGGTVSATVTGSAGNTQTAAAQPAPAAPAQTASDAAVTITAAAETQTTNGRTGEISGNDVRFRSGPSSGYTILGTYSKGQKLTITGEENGWTAVVINGVEGFVYSSYVKETTAAAPAAASETTAAQAGSVSAQTSAAVQTTANGKAGYITGNNVRLRSGPSMNYSVLAELYYGNAVTITGETNGWSAVIANGTSGYVYSSYVKEGNGEVIEAAISASVTGSAGSGSKTGAAGSDIVSFALQLVGSKYAWGGADPSTGFDCSGFTSYVYKQFGYTLNRVAQDQAKNGTAVSNSDLKPGDILCFYSGSSYIGHVGIYIGDNKFVHSCNASTGVIVSELTGYYATRGYIARRIV